MRSLGSLIRGKYRPSYQDRYYLINKDKPSLVCEGLGFGKYDVDFIWNVSDPDLDQYFLHPYYPERTIQQVELIQDVPGSRGKRGTVHQVHDDMFVLQASNNIDSPWITYTVEWIYLYPTYFKPIY